MATVFVFHHALGMTPGLAALSERLRTTGREVVVPDLFERATFDSIDDGVAYAQAAGFDVIADRGVTAAAGVEDSIVTMGVSLGAVPAQRLAQTDGRVIGTVLSSAALPVSAFGDEWPTGVGVEIHLGESDPWAEEDLDAARELAAAAGGSLRLYPTDAHLFADSSAPDHEPELADQVIGRIIDFLDQLETSP